MINALIFLRSYDESSDELNYCLDLLEGLPFNIKICKEEDQNNYTKLFRFFEKDFLNRLKLIFVFEDQVEKLKNILLKLSKVDILIIPRGIKFWQPKNINLFVEIDQVKNYGSFDLIKLVATERDSLFTFLNFYNIKEKLNGVFRYELQYTFKDFNTHFEWNQSKENFNIKEFLGIHKIGEITVIGPNRAIYKELITQKDILKEIRTPIYFILN